LIRFSSLTARFAGSGSGGLEEMRALFKNDAIIYGLVRCNEQIDDTVAVKFCFVDWRGENINRMQRANLGIHSGTLIMAVLSFLVFFFDDYYYFS
jgi:hypothetical protein